MFLAYNKVVGVTTAIALPEGSATSLSRNKTTGREPEEVAPSIRAANRLKRYYADHFSGSRADIFCIWRREADLKIPTAH